VSVLVEVECVPPQGGSLFFQPLQRALRGVIDVRQMPEADAALLRGWPDPVPGQRVGLTADGVGYVADPVHNNAALKVKIEALGFRLPPAREEFPDTHAPTFLYWLKRCVDSGLARVVSGTLPEHIDGKPRKRFLSPEEEDPRDAQVKRLESQNQTLVRLLVSKLTPAERRAFEEAQAAEAP
jgi:hypothetical protein